MPNTREKPIELISKWDVVNKLIRLENNYQFYKDVWDADVLYRRIVELEIGIGKTPGMTVQQWIPVTERLPENTGRYLTGNIRANDEKCVFDLWFDCGEWYIDENDDEFIYKVTHWMPLPEPPKE